MRLSDGDRLPVPEKESAMWNVMLYAGGWALVGVVVAFWVWWTHRERKMLRNGMWADWK